MSKEEYLEMLYQKLNIPRQLLIKYIHSVGTNEENIKDYAMNASCAVVRKDNGFQIDYTAEMINNKDQKIDQLKQQLAEKQNEIDEINKEFVQAVHDWKALCAKKDEEIEDCKRNELYEENMKILAVKNRTQLAIQVLEKVNTILYESHYKTIGNKYYATLEDIENVISEQIELLKGEKNNG